MKNLTDYSKAREILEEICNASSLELTLTEAKDYIKELQDMYGELKQEYWLEIECEDWRLIHKDSVDEIWTESLIEQIEENWDLEDLPSFVSIDWEMTAENCKVDGMGHHFSSYDGEEYEASNYYLFRTN